MDYLFCLSFFYIMTFSCYSNLFILRAFSRLIDRSSSMFESMTYLCLAASSLICSYFWILVLNICFLASDIPSSICFRIVWLLSFISLVSLISSSDLLSYSRSLFNRSWIIWWRLILFCWSKVLYLLCSSLRRNTKYRFFIISILSLTALSLLIALIGLSPWLFLLIFNGSVVDWISLT